MLPAHAHQPAPRPIRVAIVDDDAGYRDALRQVLQRASDMRLTGSAGCQADALALLDAAPADVLLVDPALPDGSGIAVIQAAARQWPACGILVSTHCTDALHVMRSIEAGAVGYLLKDGTRNEMVDDIRSVASGGSPISPVIARQMLTHLRPGAAPPPERQSVETPAPLSAREQQVLTYISKGFTAQEIAQLMVLSHFTVRSFVRRLYSKLKVTSKAEALYEARTLGWLHD